MKTDQTFIGAYSRHRRGQSPRGRSAAGHAPGETEPVPPTESVKSVEALVREELAGQPVNATRENGSGAHLGDNVFLPQPGSQVYETTPAWIDEVSGQVLRIDPPASPSPTVEPRSDFAETAHQSISSPPGPRGPHPHTTPSDDAVLRSGFSVGRTDGNQHLADNDEGQLFFADTEDAALIEQRLLETPELRPSAASDQMSAPEGHRLDHANWQHEQPVAEDLIAEAQARSVHTESTPGALEDRWKGAAWEVDAFDVPHNVAELFFEEVFFRSIAEHMEQSVRSGLRSVLVTSIAAGEGRSTVSIGTAIAAAASGLRVALVDVDLDAPSQHDQLHLEIESDWVTAIRQGESLESVAIASIEDSVTLLPMLAIEGQTLPVTEMEIDRLLARLDGCFDLVLFDGPSIRSWATARIAAAVDSSLIVRDARSTSRADISHAAERLRRQGVQGVGVVDNFCG